MSFWFWMWVFGKGETEETKTEEMNYDPKHERTCRSCCKKFKTEDGILEKENFNCANCYQTAIEANKKWKTEMPYYGIGIIVIGCLIVGMVIGYFWGNKKEEDDY